MMISTMYAISLVIVSIIIGGGSFSKGITITNHIIKTRNFTCTINNTNRRTVRERLRLFRNARAKEIAIFHTDEYENCKTWADAAKCKQIESMMLSCDEHGVRCEKISCRRSCDIALLPTTNEVPCKKKQRRDWYDDLRDEYLDHLNPDNVLRNEALFKILFFGKVHDLINECDKEEDEDYLSMVIGSMYDMFELLNNDERSNLVDEMYEVREVLVAIGGQEYSNYYNLMIYYLNNAKGKGLVDYEYVSTSDLSAKHTFYESFSLVYGDFISELIKEIYEDDDEVEVDWWYTIWPPLGEWKLSIPEERGVSILTILSKARFELVDDGLLLISENVIDYVLNKGMLNMYGQFTPSDEEAGSSKVSPLKAEIDKFVKPQEEVYLPPVSDQLAIKQWLVDLREYFIAYSAYENEHGRTEYQLQQEPFLFQGYFVGKMIELVVPKVYGKQDKRINSYSFTKLSFPKINDTEKRDRISAYMLSLLSNEERTSLLRDLDKLERKTLRIASLGIKQLGFDFNNLMEFFLDYALVVEESKSILKAVNVESKHENATRQEAQQILDFYQKVLVAAHDEGFLVAAHDEGGDPAAMGRIYIDMFTQLDNDDERSLLENGWYEAEEVLSPLSENEEYFHWYNIMTYFDNLAKGTELEYVSSSVLFRNYDMFERFLPYDYDADEASNSNDDSDGSSITAKIASALTSKPHPDIKDIWSWSDLSDVMLVDVCDQVGYGKGLLPLILDKDRLLRAAKECHIIQAFRGVLTDQYEEWKGKEMNRRDAIDYMVSHIRITDDYRSDLRAYINEELLKEGEPRNYPSTENTYPEGQQLDNIMEAAAFTVIWVLALTMLCVVAIALLVLSFGFSKSNHSRPMKKKKAMKPKNAKKKEKTSIYSQLISYIHHVHTMVLDTSSKLCGIICKAPSLLLVASLTAFDLVTDAIRSTANVSFGTIQHLFTSICSILRRGIHCLVVIPQMISIGIGMLIRLPPKLIRQATGTEHVVSTDQPSNSSPQPPQLVMSPSSAVSVVAVDEKKVNSLVEQNFIRKLETVHNNLDEESTPAAAIQQEEDVPSEIGIVNSSQVLTYDTTKASTSSLNDKSNISKAHSNFTLNENDPLLIFLRSHESCIKGSVDEFYTWLVKYENIDSMMALKEAVSDDDYLNDTMRIGDRSYGVKGFKLKSFRCAILEYKDTKPAQQGSKVAMNPPEELVCPISLALMTKDPVVAADGITYERASIEDWFEKSKARISEAQANLENSPHSEVDQRVVNNGICSPVHGSRMESLTLMPNTVVRNMARAYEGKREGVQ